VPGGDGGEGRRGNWGASQRTRASKRERDGGRRLGVARAKKIGATKDKCPGGGEEVWNRRGVCVRMEDR